MNQIDFLSKIEEKISVFFQDIFAIQVINLNDGIKQEKECIDKASPEWQIFVQDFNKYFQLFPNDVRKEEMEKLISRNTIDNNWIGDARIFINTLKNDIIE